MPWASGGSCRSELLLELPPQGHGRWALRERPSAGPAPGPLKAWVSTWAYLRAETREVSCRTTEASRDYKSIPLTPREALYLHAVVGKFSEKDLPYGSRLPGQSSPVK